MKKKIIIPLIASAIIVVLVIALLIIFLPPSQQVHPLQLGEKKAIILGSANDFYRKDGQPDFNDGEDSKFNSETLGWPLGINYNNGWIVTESNWTGHDTPGFVQFMAKLNFSNAYINLEFVYNWTNYFELYKYAAYNLSVWVNISSNINFPPVNPGIIDPFTGAGARIGLRWLNSSNDVIRTDWSAGIFGPFSGWTFLNATGIADSSTLNEITQLHLVLAVEGNMTGGDMVLFDDVKVQHWTPPPIPVPFPSQIDSDGFPAQALQVYWILKNHSYSDDNIFFMLYHTNDNDIDINATDEIGNDLTWAVIDVANDDVNASRFMQELNISSPGSFASEIESNDELIIFITDHGSNKVLSDGNATFHFEADDSYITETEFINLVQQISSKSMLINIDMCFSGNFLNENSNIGSSWYNLPNTPDFILITSSADSLSWYWRDNTNADGFAGSWFFHQFWNQLDHDKTVGVAYNFAINRIPAGRVKTIYETQTPLIHDPKGWQNTWTL